MTAPIPPHNTEAEQAVLGAMMLSGEAIAQVADLGLRAEDFYRSGHRAVYKALTDLCARGQPVDVVTAKEELLHQGALESVGGALYLQHLVETVATPASAAHYARIVGDHSELRQLLEATDLVTKAAARGNLEEAREAFVATADRVRKNHRGFNPDPLDWQRLQAEGIPSIDYVDEPYIPAGARVWASGPAESGKSLWAMRLTTQVTRQGCRVVVVSQENPLPEEARRLGLLTPDWSKLTFFHHQGFDLANQEHAASLIDAARGAALVVIDTLGACWSGDENDNAAISGLDRNVLEPLVRTTGGSVVILDHTGHPVPFTSRKGVSAARGASRKGQVADVVLEFRPEGPNGFTIIHAKNRFGGVTVPDTTYQVIDIGGGLDIIPSEAQENERIRMVADLMVTFTETGGFLTTNDLRKAVKGIGGKALQDQAMHLLQAEDPPRISASWETVQTARGHQRAKVWRPSRGNPKVVPDNLGGESQGSPEVVPLGTPRTTWTTSHPETPGNPKEAGTT